MRYFKIFFLNFNYLLAHRSRPLVYVFTYVFNSLLYLAFIRGVFQHSSNLSGWNLSTITSYYFLLIPAAATLMTHPELPIFRDDIERGELAGRLLKPFSYYWQRFYIEIPVRIFQSTVGILIFVSLSIFFGNFLQINVSLPKVSIILFIVVLAYMISFTFKMIVGMSALWLTDVRGLRELVDVMILIFAGYIVPNSFLPGVLEKISYFLPFAYIIYFPVIALQGKLNINALISVISIQLVWLLVLSFLYKYIWQKGLIKFTDFGQ